MGNQEAHCIPVLYIPVPCWLHTPISTRQNTTPGAGITTGTDQHPSSNPTCLLLGTLAAEELSRFLSRRMEDAAPYTWWD